MKLKSVIHILFFVIFLSLFTIFPVETYASGSGYWHTSGNQILDSNNNQVRIAGVNWFGFETGSFAPHGLWTRGYKDMMDQMKKLGFNTIRLPYSDDIFNAANVPNGIDAGKNPDLQGLSALSVMDKIVDYAGKIGMRVILDRHRPNKDSQSPLWYTDSVSEATWIDHWKTLVRRYKGNPTVIAVDLHNEPNGAACWGCGDQSKDWKAAAERAGNAILSENSNVLIVVEGIQTIGSHWYWWGGELEGVRNAPVSLNVANRVVYSPHDYPQSVWNQSWFNEVNYPNNLPALWDTIWGYIHKENRAPIVIGEFGSKLETQNDKQWYSTLTSYIKSNNLSWIYWSWNPNSGDTGGILADDWQSVNWDKLNALTPLQFSLDTVASVATVVSTATSTPTPSPSPVPNAVKLASPSVTVAIPASPTPTRASSSGTICQIVYSVVSSWNNNGFNASVDIKNTSTQPIVGWSLVWKFAGNQQIQNLWNGSYSQSGSDVKVSNADWNKIIQPGGSVNFGFVGAYSGSNQSLSAFRLNDGECK